MSYETSMNVDAVNITIAVMGPKGAGKTTFIKCVGEGAPTREDKFPPSTKFQVDCRNITLLEIPALDSSRLDAGGSPRRDARGGVKRNSRIVARGDADTLTGLTDFLSSKYKKGCCLNGVIYLHPITENRMVGSDKRNYDLFQQLCGDEAFQNTIIVTNKWETVDRERVGIKEEQERELKRNNMFFRPALESGSQLLHHDNTAKSARNILRKLMDRPSVPLQIQRELVEKRVGLARTTAGIRFLEYLAGKEQKLLKSLQEVQTDLRGVQNSDDREDLGAQERKLDESLKRVLMERKKVDAQYPGKQWRFRKDARGR